MPKRKKNHQRRPVAITLIALAVVVLFLVRLYQFFEPLTRNAIFRNGITTALWVGWQPTPLGWILITSFAYLLLSLAGIVVLLGFLRQQRWSWIFLMTWTGASLVICLMDYFYSRPNYIVMASNVIIAFALNGPAVQAAFGIRSEDGSSH